MRLLTIINPAAGREVFQKEIRSLLANLKQSGPYSAIDLIETKGSGHAAIIAAEKSKDYDICLAVGGDGTVHEVVNGLMKTEHKIPLAIVAAGTVNDFAFAMDLPRDKEGIRRMLLNPETRMIDLGHCGGDYFFNVCAGGMLADVAYRTTRTSKTMFGRLAYILNAAIDLPVRLFKPLHLSIETDGELFSGPAYLFMIANTRSVGGFRSIAPDSSPEDGLLDLIAIRAEGPFAAGSMASLLLRTMNKSHVEHRNFYYRQAKKIAIKEVDNKDTLLDMDGEQKGALPAEIEVIPAVLPIIVPRDL